MAQPRLLIANRGEIAVRVMRTCREMGIPTVAVYSDADREALFVEMADDAYHLGPASSSESYLNIPRILEVAGRAGATLVHPGYGFLAENAGFARAVAEAGLTFVGPPPAAMTLMGDKAAARRTAEGVGAPTIPGTPEPITADRHGHVSFLGERDCSLQRRYQKLVEESPSPVVDEGLRARIGQAAVDIASAGGYLNAGTVEFLVEEDGSFYFIEMNARLQVEHPVTEMVSGLDLVHLQLLVALDEEVEMEPRTRGHAIECRINAEDPYRDFLPGPGLITSYRPPGGPFVRLDSGVAEGRRVVGDYDSLVAKLVVWGEDRENTRRRMLRALDEFVVEGIPTTMPFHRWDLDSVPFRSGIVQER